MAPQSVNKRKTAVELNPPMKPKVRKTNNLETMTKAAIITVYKELEVEFGKLVKENKLIREENVSLLKDKIAEPKSDKVTQTEALLDEAKYPCSICVYVAGCPDELCWHMKGSITIFAKFAESHLMLKMT